MKAPSFLQGAALAFVLSLVGSGLFALLIPATGAEPALQFIIALSAMSYLLFLLRGSSARVGRVSTVAAWGIASGMAWLVDPGLLAYLLIQLALLWLVRSLYFYHSLLAALADMGLQGLSLAAAIWALQNTGSLLLCLWCFFLVQALFVAIPPSGLGPVPSALDSPSRQNCFQRAHRSAEAALRRLC